MDWNELFPSDKQPTMEDIADYMGKAETLWRSLVAYFESVYRAAPKLTYSCCTLKPGWNVKFQKSGQNFGTFYPERDSFEVMFVISYKFDAAMDLTLSLLSDATANQWRSAQDYCTLGKTIMLRIGNEQVLEDYKKIIAVKLAPKYV